MKEAEPNQGHAIPTDFRGWKMVMLHWERGSRYFHKAMGVNIPSQNFWSDVFENDRKMDFEEISHDAFHEWETSKRRLTVYGKLMLCGNIVPVRLYLSSTDYCYDKIPQGKQPLREVFVQLPIRGYSSSL